MTYSVKEIFYSLQGEGAHAGRPAVFCRFSGCNLWSGREADRAEAVCQFCDTDFRGTDGPGGGAFRSPSDLANAIEGAWPDKGSVHRFVVLTGGEPLLQVDQALIEALHAQGFAIAIETNGTTIPPDGIDWICVSPKAGAVLRLVSGDELKVVYPQPGAEPESYEHLAFTHRYIQPMDGPKVDENTRAAVEYCLRRPAWRLSLQTHKLLNIP